MVTLIRADRRSAVLTPSSLACLLHIPTVNLTSGCAHGCLYCYAQGYSTHPGKDKVVLYQNTLEKLKSELTHKRMKPWAVYFSPSSDFFQPVPEVLELGYCILEILFSKDIGVAFLSKGRIPEKTMNLLLSHADKVRAQIGIITLDEDIQRIFEPNTASLSVRLNQMARLAAGGVATKARLDPILPGLTDTPNMLGQLFSALSTAGVKSAAISTLFLRPSVLESLRSHVHDHGIFKKLLDSYGDAKRLAIHAEHSSVMALPQKKREKIYTRVRHAAEKFGIDISVCSCKNPDLNSGTCNISGTWPKCDTQPKLFDKED